MPGQGKHSDKWDRCVQHVKDKGGPYNPYAVCTANISESCNCAELPFQGAFAHIKKEKKEAITGSSMPQLGRAGVKDVEIK